MAADPTVIETKAAELWEGSAELVNLRSEDTPLPPSLSAT
jgi:hypothetical protein